MTLPLRPPVHANLSPDSVMLRLACEAGSLANFVERILFFAKWKHDMIEMLETHVTLQSRNFTSRVAKETELPICCPGVWLVPTTRQCETLRPFSLPLPSHLTVPERETVPEWQSHMVETSILLPTLIDIFGVLLF